jgi:AcrR family transcriptional regulator
MNTKEKIIEVAQNLFLQKGFERTSIREIALKAGINLAAMNYHFGSKENLFDLIFKKLLSNYAPSLPDILNADLTFEEKIFKYIDSYTDVLISNPQLPLFVMSVLHKNPKKIMKMSIFSMLYMTDSFTNQVNKEIRKGNIIKIEPLHFFVNILSLVTFPFAIKEVIMNDNNLDEKGFKKFMNDRKKIVFDTVMLSVKPK